MQLHIFTDIVTAGVEGCLLIFRQVVFYDLFDTVCSDDSRDAHENAVLAVFTVQQCADGDDRLLVVEDRRDQTAEGGADSVFGAALAVDSHPCIGDRLLLDGVIVKNEPAVFFCEISEGCPPKEIWDQGIMIELPCSPIMQPEMEL